MEGKTVLGGAQCGEEGHLKQGTLLLKCSRMQKCHQTIKSHSSFSVKRHRLQTQRPVLPAAVGAVTCAFPGRARLSAGRSRRQGLCFSCSSRSLTHPLVFLPRRPACLSPNTSSDSGLHEAALFLSAVKGHRLFWDLPLCPFACLLAVAEMGANASFWD